MTSHLKTGTFALAMFTALNSTASYAQDSSSEFSFNGLTLEVSYERGNLDDTGESIQRFIQDSTNGSELPLTLNLNFGASNRTSNGVLTVNSITREALTDSPSRQASGQLFDVSDEFTAGLRFDVTPSLTTLLRASYARLSIDGSSLSLNETFNTTASVSIDFQNPNPCAPPVFCIVAPPVDFYDIPNANIIYTDMRAQTFDFDTTGIFAIEIGLRFRPEFLAFEISDKPIRPYAEISGGLAYVDGISATLSGTGTRLEDLVQSDEFMQASLNSFGTFPADRLDVAGTAFRETFDISKGAATPVGGLAAGIDIEITPQDHILFNIGYRKLTIDTELPGGDYDMKTTKFGIRYAHKF